MFVTTPPCMTTSLCMGWMSINAHIVSHIYMGVNNQAQSNKFLQDSTAFVYCPAPSYPVLQGSRTS
jgi:hypothetical protein